jgi:tetratricopeptide (TPR) repeat protein
MGRIEKTVFLSYRRTNAPWALAISQSLTHHGFDVFFDFNGIASGDFESVILENIRARAHFIVLLTPSALERCGEAGDWLRREIETALEIKRNIIALTLEGFSFGTPSIASQLTGTLAPLRSYNALPVPVEYFDEAMDRLRTKFLNVPLDMVLHPASVSAVRAAKVEQAAATAAPAVTTNELTAQEWFERGFKATLPDEKVHSYNEAIRLQPNYPEAFYNRGLARYYKGELDSALADYNEAIRLKLDFADAFYNRGLARHKKGDLEPAFKDYSEAIRLKPNYANAFDNRGAVRRIQGDLEGALKDHNEAIRFKPDDLAVSYNNRGYVRRLQGDFEGALEDYNEGIRLKPDSPDPYYGRALVSQKWNHTAAAIADFQRFLDLGGGTKDGFKEKAEQWIRDLKMKL